MKTILEFTALMAIVAGAAMAQETPPDNGQPPYGVQQDEDDAPVVYEATCELPGGFGLIAFVDDAALLAEIEGRLAAGERVMVDVAGTEVVRVAPDGAMHVIGIVTGPGGRAIACYQSF